MSANSRESLLESAVAKLMIGAKLCSSLVHKTLKPKNDESITICFAIYLFGRVDVGLVRNHVDNAYRESVYDLFQASLERLSLRTDKKVLSQMMNEQLGRYGEVFRSKSGGEAFEALHEYLYQLLTAVSLHKRPTLWVRGKDPIVIEGIDKLMQLRMLLSEVEKQVIIPLDKECVDLLVQSPSGASNTEVKGEAALRTFFREQKEWNRIPESFTNALIQRLIDSQGSVLIELFHVMYSNDLIEKLLVPMCARITDSDTILHSFTDALFKIGTTLKDALLDGHDLGKETIREFYAQSTEAYRSAIALEPRHFLAKLQLADLYKSISQMDKAISYWRQSLSDIEAIKLKPENERSQFEKAVMQEQIEPLKLQVAKALEDVQKTAE